MYVSSFSTPRLDYDFFMTIQKCMYKVFTLYVLSTFYYKYFFIAAQSRWKERLKVDCTTFF